MKTIQMKPRGILLQKVHFPQFIEGYEVYFNSVGSCSFIAQNPIRTLFVSNNEIYFTAQTRQAFINGKKVPVLEKVALNKTNFQGEHDASSSENHPMLPHRYIIDVDLFRAEILIFINKTNKHWPYLAEILLDSREQVLSPNKQHFIGRRTDASVRLPSRKNNQNLVWVPQLSQRDNIPTKSGPIPKSQFSSDTIMVSSEHAVLDLRDEVQPIIRNLAKNCCSFVIRKKQLLTLIPNRPDNISQREEVLELGDHIYIGNHMFEVDVVDYQDNNDLTATYFIDNVALFDVSRMMFLRRVSPQQRKAEAENREKTQAAQVSSGESSSLDEDSDIIAMDSEETLPINEDPASDNTSKDETQKTTEEFSNVSPQPTQPSTTPPSTTQQSSNLQTEVSVQSTGNVSQVCFRNEEEWELSCTLPYQLSLIGWATRGEQFFGNSTDSDMIVPESCFGSAEHLKSAKYFSLKTRRGKGTISAKGHSDGLLFNRASQMPALEKDTQFDIGKVYLECIRRDNDGEADFSIFIHKQDAFSIPGFTFFAPSSFADKIEISSMQKSFLTFGFSHNSSLKIQQENLIVSHSDSGVYLEILESEDAEGKRIFIKEPTSSAFIQVNSKKFALTSGMKVVVGTHCFEYIQI